MTRALAALLIVCGLAAPLRAQIDPEQRRLIQLGYDWPMSGPKPSGAYAFYYINQPHFVRKDLTLRLAVAPVYVDGELGVSGRPEDGNGVAIGLAGGGWADSYNEIHQGHFLREESFNGHSGTVSLSYYHNLEPDWRIPVNVVARGSAHLAVYQRRSQTRDDFVLPPDHAEYSARLGLRIGGIPPELLPARAAELSFWYVPYVRDHAGDYGLGEDRKLERVTELFWTRLRFAYRLPNVSRVEFSAEAGASRMADRFDAYRLGGMLPFASEFPLSLPGYYNGELSARQYALFTARYSQPVGLNKALRWALFGSAADVGYLPGLEQPKPWNTGLGSGLVYRSPADVWLVELQVGHGFNAIRSGGRGGDSVALLAQFDLMAWRRKEAPKRRLQPTPSKPLGLGWLGQLIAP